MKIYTKTGDQGTTGLFRAGRVSKIHPLIEAIGTVDELNAAIGVLDASVRSTAAEMCPEKQSCVQDLNAIQHHLFDLGAALASVQPCDAERDRKPVLEGVSSTLEGDQHDSQDESKASSPETSSTETSSTETGGLTTSEVEWLEQRIDSIDDRLAPLKQFILPGGTPASASAHLARAICRRAERSVILLHPEIENGDLNINASIYLNRLSDWLFVLARYLNHLDSVPDVPWQAKTT